MKKGDERKQVIVSAAEKLFYEKGFENTSVQDVLNETGISKGGFYHHFESKLKLLEEICDQRTERSFQYACQAVEQCEGDAVRKMNLIFDIGSFFTEKDLEYVGLVMHVIYRDGCVQLRDMMRQLRIRYYNPLLTQIIHQGMREKCFYTPHPDGVGRLILMLNNDLTDEVASALLRMQDNPDELNDIVEMLDAYRCAMERILNAPYGTLDLLSLPRVMEVARWLHNQKRKMEQTNAQ